jgi:hypothetical protein
VKRGKRELIFLIFAKKKKLSKNGRLGVSSLSVLQKQQKRNISENIFAPQSLNTRSSRSVLITIQRRVVSRGARD